MIDENQQDASTERADSVSYRRSHLSKGLDYDSDFREIPQRKLTWKIEQRILNKILKRFLARREIDHLDFACGTGRILSHLESHVRSSTGLDISSSMLEVARTRVPQARLLEGDITRSRVFLGSQYDLITAFRFFPNAEPELRKEAMHELVQNLRFNGVLIFNNHRSTTFTRSRFARLVTRGKRGNYGMSPREARCLIRNAGLEVASTYHTTIVPECEDRPFRPRWLVERLEEMGTRLPVSQLAGNMIYVCRKAKPFEGDHVQQVRNSGNL